MYCERSLCLLLDILSVRNMCSFVSSSLLLGSSATLIYSGMIYQTTDSINCATLFIYIKITCSTKDDLNFFRVLPSFNRNL